MNHAHPPGLAALVLVRAASGSGVSSGMGVETMTISGVVSGGGSRVGEDVDSVGGGSGVEAVLPEEGRLVVRGLDVGFAVGRAVGAAVGAGVGAAVGTGVGLGVGFGVGRWHQSSGWPWDAGQWFAYAGAPAPRINRTAPAESRSMRKRTSIPRMLRPTRAVRQTVPPSRAAGGVGCGR